MSSHPEVHRLGFFHEVASLQSYLISESKSPCLPSPNNYPIFETTVIYAFMIINNHKEIRQFHSLQSLNQAILFYQKHSEHSFPVTKHILLKIKLAVRFSSERLYPYNILNHQY